ncbi:MAG: hypothetical protein C0404_00560 [Verrucomicrobia bacterium]|nr:hypothetical protein [Verrucomicrobiota bacterium]
MADCGFNAVALSFSESEMAYARRAFEIQVDLAHKAGLKVFVIPSRLGGRFAGAPLMPGIWISQHPEAQVPGYYGFGAPLACLEHKPFRYWFKEFMTTLLGDYPLDGVIWDEPKGTREISRHPDTIAKYGPDPTKENMEDGFLDFLQDITTHCHDLRTGLVVTLFNQAMYSTRFTQGSCMTEGIDYAGYDGNLSRQSYFHEEPTWSKYRIESVWERTVKECKAAGKKTFALVENMLMPKEAIPEYEQNLEAYLQVYRPDHLSLYYYAHNNEDPEKVHEITRRLMKKHLGG